jgi:cold shock CspA family protein
MNKEIELLDFCRVKKIFEKGFGFLSSINYKKDVFFHFSKIKDESVKEELDKLKRGVVYIYYTSKAVGEKRKVFRMWLNLQSVPPDLIPAFVFKIIDELNEGQTNPFELAYVVKQLRTENYLSRSDFELVLNSKKILTNPSIVIQMINENEIEFFDDIHEYFDKITTMKIEPKIWRTEILSKLYE